MSYIHKTTGAKISTDSYNNLTYYEKNNFVKESTTNHNSSGDFLVSTAIGAATGSALLGGIVGGDIVGGIVGDLLEGGGLFD